ncbi:MAG: hypothetical protein PVF83_04900 [Anaerolineales bacterium]|jgi:hypothetical protein
MQTFYDNLFSSETPENWKFQLTQVDLEELGVIIKASRAWQPWGEAEEEE